MSSQSVVQSTVPPFNSGYSTETDVGRKFGNDTLFSASTTPNITQVRDIIVMKDSWIDNAFGRDFRQHQVTETYDAIGVGRRAGQILLRNTPIISVERVEYRVEGGNPNSRDAWIPGVAGSSAEAASVSVTSGSAKAAADWYYVYPEKALIWWGRLRYSLPLKYRVTYTYGYPSVPDWVRDLSRTLAAIEVMTTFAGKFMPPEPLPTYELRFERDVQFLMTMGGRKPLAGAA